MIYPELSGNHTFARLLSLPLQTVAGEKVEGQGGRRTRTSSVSSTSSRFHKSWKAMVSWLLYLIVSFRDGGVPQGHRGFLQPRLREQAPSKVSVQSTRDIVPYNEHIISEPGLCLVRLVSLRLWPWSHCGCPFRRAFLGGKASSCYVPEDLSSTFWLKAGAVRCWSAERLVSPLLLASCFPEYRDWCQVRQLSCIKIWFKYVPKYKIFQVKSEVDPHGLLGSGYVQGTLTLDHK